MQEDAQTQDGGARPHPAASRSASDGIHGRHNAGKTTAPAESIHYREADGVDRLAQPLDGWVVLAGLWPPGLSTIRVRIWIAADGTVERWLPEGAAADDEGVKASLAHLGETFANPALRNGKAVPSVRLIELVRESADVRQAIGQAAAAGVPPGQAAGAAPAPQNSALP